jgi:hypothetical protein
MGMALSVDLAKSPASDALVTDNVAKGDAPKRKTALQKFLSLHAYRRRWGASHYWSHDVDLQMMKTRLVEADRAEPVRGSAKSIHQHMDNLVAAIEQ